MKHTDTEWFDASDLLEDDPAPLPRFHCPELDGPELEDPFPLVRTARPPAVPGLVRVAAAADFEDTIRALPTWTILGVPCLPVGASPGGRQ